jgi:hypothetical protein
VVGSCVAPSNKLQGDAAGARECGNPFTYLVAGAAAEAAEEAAMAAFEAAIEASEAAAEAMAASEAADIAASDAVASAGFLWQAATESAATATPATRILRRTSEVIVPGPLMGVTALNLRIRHPSPTA